MRLICPRCGHNLIRPSVPSGIVDHLLSAMLLSPYRCRRCRARFYRYFGHARDWEPELVDTPAKPERTTRPEAPPVATAVKTAPEPPRPAQPNEPGWDAALAYALGPKTPEPQPETQAPLCRITFRSPSAPNR